jgi:hypothetical protein
MAVKSALMTTAYQTTKTGPNTGKVFGGPFDFGAGHVDPLAALQPGLVLLSQPEDWDRFTCGALEEDSKMSNLCPECMQEPDLCNPRNLNMPAIAVARLAAATTVRRRFTSVLSGPATFNASSIINPPGFEITVTPSFFNLEPAASISVQISVRHVGEGGQMVYDQYKDGAITWTSGGGGGTAVRLPVVVRAVKPALLASPQQVTLPKSRVATMQYPVTPGFSGTLSATVLGLQPARVRNGTAKELMPEDLDNWDSIPSVTLSLPALSQWRYVRIATFDEDYAAGTDLDLVVVDQKGNFIDWSVNIDSSQEEINLVNTTDTKVTVYVVGWIVPSGVTPFKLYTWTLTQPSPASSNTLWKPTANRPRAVAPGDTVDISLTFNSRLLSPTMKWLGAVLYAIKRFNHTQIETLPQRSLIYMP